MNPAAPQSVEMSQESANGSAHLKRMVATASAPIHRRIDPASRRAHKAYDGLSASSIGLELGLSVVVGVAGGMWLDGHFGLAPWCMLAGLGFGLAAGFRGLFRAVRRADQAAAEQELLDQPVHRG
jgi:ATP synthase protein I